MKKNKDGRSPYVYSTDPSFQFGEDGQQESTLSPKEQHLRVSLETKHRAGKTVTLIRGFVGTEADLTDLGKQLKGNCGTGGAVKDGEIILQGDHREKVKAWLISKGYSAK